MFNDGDKVKAVQTINLPGDVVAVNVYYFECEFAESQPDDSVGAAIESWIETLYGTLADEVQGGVELSDLYVYKSQWPFWELRSTRTPTDNFIAADEMLPHGVAALVRAYTDHSRTIARKYIPGFTEAQNQHGNWVAGALAALGNFCAAWDNSVSIAGGNNLYPGTMQQSIGAFWRLTGETVVLAIPAYQRRRRPGVGI